MQSSSSTTFPVRVPASDISWAQLIAQSQPFCSDCQGLLAEIKIAKLKIRPMLHSCLVGLPVSANSQALSAYWL